MDQRFPLAPTGDGEYLLSALAVASLAGSQRFEVVLGSNETTIEFDYFPFSEKLLERFPTGEPKVLDWPARSLVIALQAGFVAGAPKVDFEQWDGQSGLRWKLTPEGARSEALTRSPLRTGEPGCRIVVRFRTGFSRNIFRVGGKTEAGERITLFSERAPYAGPRVAIDGEPLNRAFDLGSASLLFTFEPEDTGGGPKPPEILSQAPLELPVAASLQYFAKVSLTDELEESSVVVCRGLHYPVEVPLFEDLGLRGVLVCDELQISPDLTTLVEDGSFENLLEALESDLLAVAPQLVSLLERSEEEIQDRLLELLRQFIESHRTAGETAEALELLGVMSEVGALPLADRADLATQQARLLEQLEQVEESYQVYERALGLWEQVEPEARETESFCTALLGAGYLLSVSGVENERALEYARKALELKREEGAGLDDPQRGLAAELLGWLYLHYTSYPEPEFLEAEELLNEALASHEVTYGTTHAEVADVLQNLGEFYRFRGAFEEAEKHFLRALAIREKLFGSRHETVGQLFDLLGTLFETAGDIGKAGHYYGRALEIWGQLLGPEHEEVIRRLNDLVVLFRVYGRFDQAEPLYIRLLKLQEGEDSLPSLEDVPNYCSLALFYQVQSKYGQAEPLLDKALQALESRYGAEAYHPDLAWVHGLCGRFFDDQYRYKKAEEHLLKALTMSEQLLGEEHPDLVVCLEALVRHYRVQKSYDRAMLHAERALAIAERFYGMQHPYVATALNSYAELLRLSDQGDSAGPIYLAAFEIHGGGAEVLIHQVPIPNPELSRLAAVRREAEDLHRQALEPAREFSRFAEAESFYLRALFLREQVLGPNHHDNARTLQLLASLYRNHRRYEGAESLYRRSLALRQANLGNEHPDCGLSYKDLTELLLLQGKRDEAEPLLREWLELAERTLGKNHSERAEILMRQATLLEERGELDLLVDRLQEALIIRHSVFGTEHPTFAVTLAEMLRIEEKYEQSAELYDFVLTSLEKNLENDDPLLIPILENYSKVLSRTGREDHAVEYETRALVMRADHGLDFG